jgi:SpoVK/Ycf46/Vps4 family AAA+-type ATPase
LVCFRWDYGGLKSFLQTLNYKNTDIPVDIIMPYSSDRIGSIKKDNDNKPVANIQADYDFISLLESDLNKMCKGEMDKTGAILHGKPGNGKTFFIKYIASKYDLPVKVVSFNPDWTNHDILNLFSQVSSKCIVLFEDFDNYFDGRNCLIKSESIKFTFDTILNCFDGVYNNYKHVVFFMTVNDIDKVDEAIKNRPSRFRYVAEFKNPDFNTRLKILENKTLAEETDGLNLDQVFFEKHKNHISS